LSDAITAQIHIVNTDRPPTLQVSNHGVVVGQPFSMQLIGTDPDLGTTLTYSGPGLPTGATLDPQTGLLTWTPGPTQTGEFPIQFSVSDGELTTSLTSVLRSTLNPVPPQVIVELTPSFPDVPDSPVLIHVAASSMAPVTALTLAVNGQPVTLDSHGRASYVPQAPGIVPITATATDADGLVGSTATVLKVRDPNDHLAPVVSFDNLSAGQQLRTALDIQGTVSDGNLDSWKLEQAPLGSNDFITLASGNSVVSGTLYHFDPTVLRNGVYLLRLTAADISGRISTAETVVEADTTTKSSDYVQQDTDLTVTLGGAQIDLVRSYDSLNRDASGSFGYGWRLANSDTEIQTSVGLTGREQFGAYDPFMEGTRVYLTLPDGQRVGFTFTPEKHLQSGITYYTPAYQADPEVNYQLDSAAAVLSKGSNGFYDVKTARAYNPASGFFDGPEYTLTAADGTVYHLTTAGGVQDEILPGGAHLYFSDSGITSSTGEAVQFVHNAAGRVTTIIAPDGTRLVYSYDAQGNLISAHNTATGKSSRFGYAADDAHLLILSTSPNGSAGSAINYGPIPQATPLAADLGGPGAFDAGLYHGTLTGGGTDYLAFNLRPSEIQSTRTGNVLLGVQILAKSGSSFQPGVPAIAGLTPLVQRTSNGSSFALFAVSHEGLDRLQISGADATTSGNYSLKLFVIGDINQDGAVDGFDSALLAQAMGSSSGQPAYVAAADSNRDGTINSDDAQLLGNNYGFLASAPPVVQSTEVMTHVDLPLTFDLSSISNDIEGDPLFFRLAGTQDGTATLKPDGHSVTFIPSLGFSGQADFQFMADDGFNSSAVATVKWT
jgi:YD repeat-containing protein